MHAVARKLQECGWTVCTTGHDDSRLLKVTGKGPGSWEVVVADDGCFTCQYTPRRHHRTGPTDTARIIAHMLGTGDITPSRPLARYHGLAPAAVAGHLMRARGMTVTLEVIEDSQALSVAADVAITNPAQPGRGTVYTDDNGIIYWENDTGVLTHSIPHRRWTQAITRRSGASA
jgi:hypothetical protein